MLLTRKELAARFSGNKGEYSILLSKSKLEGVTIGDKFADTLCAVADRPAPALTYLRTRFFNTKKTSITSDVIRGNRDFIDKWLSMLDSESDDYFAEKFPFRSADDKKLRNLRSNDLRECILESSKDRQDLLFGLWHYAIDVDYIFMINLSFYILLLDDSLLTVWRGSKILSLGTWGFVDKVKEMSNYLKTEKKSKRYKWEHLVELGCLSGYRNPPVEGFSIQKEAEALAGEKGKKHDFPFDFKQYVDKHLGIQPKTKVEYIGFKDWIKLGDWATSGASSFGRIDLKDLTTGRIKKIKCRKNFVLDVESVDVLYNLALASDHQTNKVLLKCELGKIRLAVASDLGSYLCAAYIVFLSGGSYLLWPGVTLEEKQQEKVKRMVHIKELLPDRIGVPFDFESFDKQLETGEIKDIVSIVVRSARVNFQGEKREWETLSNNCINSFDNSTLEYRNDVGDEVTLNVNSDLMSGHRMTSIIGNGFNSAASQMVIDCCVILGECRDDFSLYVQGDDTGILCQSSRQGLMVLRFYDIFKLKFGKGKFSVQQGALEYLRIWYDEFKTYSYMARTLPNLVQRKPWSNQPWEAAGVIRGIYQKMGILERRGCARDLCNTVWVVLSKKWSKLHNLPVESLNIPKQLGGLGICPWDGFSIISPHVPAFVKKGFEVKPDTSWRAEKLALQAESFGLASVDIIKMANDQLSGVVSADDVPAAALINRKQWKNAVLSKRYIISRIPMNLRIKSLSESCSFRFNSTDYESWISSVSMLKILTCRYGEFSRAIARVESVKGFLKYSEKKISLSNWIRDNEKNLWSTMKPMLKRGHIGEVLDYLGGKINLGENRINNECTDLFTRTVLLDTRSIFRNQSISQYYSLHRDYFCNQFAKNNVYAYCFGSN